MQGSGEESGGRYQTLVVDSKGAAASGGGGGGGGGVFFSADLAGAPNFNALFQEALALPHATDAALFDRSRAISRVCHEFLRHVESYARIIIAEVGVPAHLKTIPPARVGGVAGGQKFVHRGLLYKFCNQSRVCSDEYFAAKSGGHEIAAAQRVLVAGAECGLCVPLSCIFDYLGYRLLCSAIAPVSAATLVYGCADAGGACNLVDRCAEARAAMERLASRLNLKQHIVAGRGGHMAFCAPCDIEVHRGFDGRLWVLDCQRMFTAEDPAIYGGEPGGVPSSLVRLLRPELVMSAPQPLSSDCFTPFSVEPANDAHAAAVTRGLYERVIPLAARRLDRFVQSKICSDVGIFLHQYGVNVRHIGRVFELCTHPRARATLAVEAVARWLKRHARERMRGLLRNTTTAGILETSVQAELCAILNDAFGQSTSARRFWSEVLVPGVCGMYFRNYGSAAVAAASPPAPPPATGGGGGGGGAEHAAARLSEWGLAVGPCGQIVDTWATFLRLHALMPFELGPQAADEMYGGAPLGEVVPEFLPHAYSPSLALLDRLKKKLAASDSSRSRRRAYVRTCVVLTRLQDPAPFDSFDIVRITPRVKHFHVVPLADAICKSFAAEQVERSERKIASLCGAAHDFLVAAGTSPAEINPSTCRVMQGVVAACAAAAAAATEEGGAPASVGAPDVRASGGGGGGGTASTSGAAPLPDAGAAVSSLLAFWYATDSVLYASWARCVRHHAALVESDAPTTALRMRTDADAYDAYTKTAADAVASACRCPPGGSPCDVAAAAASDTPLVPRRTRALTGRDVGPALHEHSSRPADDAAAAGAADERRAERRARGGGGGAARADREPAEVPPLGRQVSGGTSEYSDSGGDDDAPVAATTGPGGGGGGGGVVGS